VPRNVSASSGTGTATDHAPAKGSVHHRKGSLVTTPCYVLITMVLLAPTAAWAQDPLENGVRRVSPGQLVRIKTQDGQLLEGRFSAFAPEPPSLQLTDRAGPLPAASIDSLWVRGTHAKRGAIIGALLLGVSSGIFWSSVCEYAGEGSGCDAWGAVAGLTLAGAGVGAGLGALIGSASPRWRLRYARSGIALRLRTSPSRVGFSVTVPVSASN
jgi:hypothetical protein